MQSTVFVELKFWLLIVVSVVVPMFMYLLQRRKNEVSPAFVFVFGLVLIAISGLDVYLLQALATESRFTHSLMDNAIFNSEMSLSLYVFPFLFGGIGINMVSDMLVGHLMSAEKRYEEQHATPGPSSGTKRWREKAASGLPVQVRKSGSPGLRLMLPFTSRQTLYRKVRALIDPLEPDTQAPGIPLHEIFNPAFMVAHTRFGSIDEMSAAGGFKATSQADCEHLSGAAWSAFVRSATRFTGWEDMLQSACCHWLVGRLQAAQAKPARQRASVILARTCTVLQPSEQPWAGWAATAYGPSGNDQRSGSRDESIGRGS